MIVATAPEWLPEERADCGFCRNHGWQSRREKRPPTDPHLDPREHYQVAVVEREVCSRGHSPVAGRRRRCPDFQEAA